eukprot:6529568-Pyramimonas_sp.AAC.1
MVSGLPDSAMLPERGQGTLRHCLFPLAPPNPQVRGGPQKSEGIEGAQIGRQHCRLGPLGASWGPPVDLPNAPKKYSEAAGNFKEATKTAPREFDNLSRGKALCATCCWVIWGPPRALPKIPQGPDDALRDPQDTPRETPREGPKKTLQP